MRDNPTTSIIGGTPAQTDDFPYMVPLFMNFSSFPATAMIKILLHFYSKNI